MPVNVYVQICVCIFLFLLHWEVDLWKLRYDFYQRMLCLYSLRRVSWCHVLCLSLNHFEFIFLCMLWGCILSLIYMRLSNFPNTACWGNCSFPIVYSCVLCWRLINCRYMSLFLGCLFFPINPYVCFCANNMPFCLLELFSVVWSLGGYCFAYCFVLFPNFCFGISGSFMIL